MTLPLEQRLINREKCLRAYQLREDEGLKFSQIAREVGVDSDTVRRWLTHPQKFDPYYDEVALSRALEGETDVINRLTNWERDEMFDRIAKMRLTLDRDEWLNWFDIFTGRSGISHNSVYAILGVADDRVA